MALDLMLLIIFVVKGYWQITVEAKYIVNITKAKKNIFLSLHYNGANRFLLRKVFVKIHQFKAKDSEIKPFPLCLENIPKNFTVIKMKITGLKGSMYNFPVSYEAIDVSDIVNIHTYLIKNTVVLYKCLNSSSKHLLF